jgi:hypothetical protein
VAHTINKCFGRRPTNWVQNNQPEPLEKSCGDASLTKVNAHDESTNSASKGEFSFILARGNSESPPRATITRRSILVQRPRLLLRICTRFRLTRLLARMGGPRPDYLPCSKASSPRSERTRSEMQFVQYPRSGDPPNTPIRSAICVV